MQDPCSPPPSPSRSICDTPYLHHMSHINMHIFYTRSNAASYSKKHFGVTQMAST